MRGETSIHMESLRPKRPARPPTQHDSREPTDYVILERTHSAEFENHLLETQMRRLEEETPDSEESALKEEKNPPLVALESPPNAARMLMALLFVLIWFCSGLKLLSKL